MKKAWEAVHVEVVKKSFRSCGISVNVDGSEDKEIHCIGDGGVAPEARAEITRSTAALLAPCDEEEDDDTDPFKDISEDEQELEENETIIEDEGTIEDEGDDEDTADEDDT